MTLTISNRLLNEISIFMKEDGYPIIARKNIDPIVSKTAAAKQTIAKIVDESIISDIKFVIGRMEQNGSRADRLTQQHFEIVAA